MGSVFAVITVMFATPWILSSQSKEEVEHRGGLHLSRAGVLGISAERRPVKENFAGLKPDAAAPHPTAAEPAFILKKKVGLDAETANKSQRLTIKVSLGEHSFDEIGGHFSFPAPTSATRYGSFGFRHYPRWKIWQSSRTSDLDVHRGVGKFRSHRFLGRREWSKNVPVGEGRHRCGNHAAEVPGSDCTSGPSSGDTSGTMPHGRMRRPLALGKTIRGRRSAVRSHPPPPCPEVFSYLRDGPRGGKWYGVITLTSDRTITGVTLHIQLDKPVLLLGAWLGRVETENNKDFTIRNEEKVVKPNSPLSEKILVQYNEIQAQPPVIKKIIFNGKQICPKKDAGRSGMSSPVPLQFGQKNNDDWEKNPSIVDDKGVVIDEIVDGVPCGQIEPRPSLLIANGESTERGDWPWHAAIYQSMNNELKYICGGSIIGKNTILTAAHCVSDRRGRKDLAVAPHSRIVFLGKLLLKGSEEGVQIKEVEKIHVHPEYSSNGYEADIAIIVLSSPLEFTEYVKPVCLWNGNRPHLSEIEGHDGVVVGWGFDGNGNLTESLMMAKMPVVSQQDCIFSNPQFFSRYTSDRTFCAGYRNGTSACNGDSGGGMFFAKKRPGKANEVMMPLTWTLRGIVSLSVSQETKKICDTKHYVIFADVAKFYFWIKQHL